MERTNCPNCSAVIDPEADRCAYCGTPYANKPTTGGPVIHFDGAALARAVDRGLLTVNEARRRLGLKEV